MRILLAASGHGLAGGERNLLDIARFLADQGGWRVSAAVPARGPLGQALRELGCRVDTLPLSAFLNPRAIKRIAALVREQKVDLVHAHGTRAAFYARPAARSAGVSCVYTFHGIHYLNYSPLKRFVYLALERLMRGWSHRSIFVCRSDMEKALGAKTAAAENSVVVYNGVAPASPVEGEGEKIRRELGLAEGRPMILCVGRFHQQKGQRFLIEAAPAVFGKQPEARLVFAGDGETIGAARQLAAELGVADKISFLGERRDI
jgi:glycosyltransferase involved in cell wall biosynthesis